MKLITKKLENLFENYPIYSQDGRGGNAKIICKFFHGEWTFYVLEAEKIEDGDWTFFGIIDRNGYKEYGYINFSEMKIAFTKCGFCFIERDRYFEPISVLECNELQPWAANYFEFLSLTSQNVLRKNNENR